MKYQNRKRNKLIFSSIKYKTIATKSLYIVTLFYLLTISCNYDNPQKQQKNDGKSESVTTDSIPILWATICQNSNFSYLFDCSEENCYQIELLNDPIKDLIVITFNLSDSLTEEIRFNRFSFNTSKRYINDTKSNLNKEFSIVNPITKDTIFCIHKDAKTMKIGLEQDLKYFFSTRIWEIPASDEMTGFDGESWRIKGRNGGKEILVVRWNFSDSLYYSNIQKFLDLFRINDYKYRTK